MPRHAGESRYHDGALTHRTHKSRKERGRKRESRKAKGERKCN